MPELVSLHRGGGFFASKSHLEQLPSMLNLRLQIAGMATTEQGNESPRSPDDERVAYGAFTAQGDNMPGSTLP
jgi:hypothetical protein